MIAAFVDESGNDGRSHVFSMATIILCSVSSYFFGNDWRALLEDFGLKEFHASDFYRRQGEFRQWHDDRCRDLELAITGLFLKWQIKHCCALVEHDGYKRSFVDTGFHKTLRPAIRKWKKPYLQAFQDTVSNLREYADHQPKGIYITPVFDDCQEFMGQARADYAQKNSDGKLGQMYVSRTREYVQLQAADFLAWQYRVDVERCITRRESNPGPVLAALLEHMFGAKVWSFEFLDYLRRRVEAVISGVDPESVPFCGSR
jgi:hypothetical protein